VDFCVDGAEHSDYNVTYNMGVSSWLSKEMGLNVNKARQILWTGNLED
jgi:hypothetical protein